MLNQNPMSQMAMASKLSIPQLQQALRDGTVDPIIGQTILRQKIKQNEDAKNAMAAMQPAQPPVAQQNLAYGQGVSGLPTNMPTQGMADGGIIAFAGNDPRVGSLVPETDDSIDDLSTIGNITPLGAGYSALRNVGSIVRGPAVQDVMNLPRLIGESEKAYLARVANALRISPSAQPAPQKKPTVASTTADLSMTPNEAGRRAMAGAPTGIAPADADMPATDFYKLLGGASSSGASVRDRSGIAGLGPSGYKITPYDTKNAERTLAEAEAAPHTYEGIAAENEAQARAAGIDPDIYKKQMQELEGKKAKSESRSKLDEAMPWFAASKAFGEAKGNEGLGTSISRALYGYGTTKGELSDKEETRLDGIRKESNQLAIAQNAFQQAVLSGNKHDLDKASSDIKAARSALDSYKVKGIDAQNEAAKTAAELQNRWGIAQMQEHGAMARQGKEDRVIAGIATVIQKANPKMAPDEVLRQAYLTKGASSVYGADIRADTAINKQIADLTAKLPLAFTPEAKAAITSQISALKAKLSGGAAEPTTATGTLKQTGDGKFTYGY